ncbi:MAG: TIGR01777 family oxidoreductase [Myxococcota bacterium]|jgi:hypothetical protein|nr:TIGR01777 family oxidoreductase [Myxococcota bacterium]
MHVLITGATGFIGRQVCRHLADEGHVVSALTRGSPERCMATTDVARAWTWQSERELPPPESLTGQDAVIHLAGESIKGRWTAKKKRAILDSRVLGTRHLVRALSEAAPRPGVLLTASAHGYYGDRGDEVLTEDADSGSDFVARVCREWENESHAAQQLGVRTVQLRLGLVMGAGGALGPLRLISSMGIGGALGDGRQWWSWIHVDDLARLCGFALTHDVRGPLNAASPHPVRQQDFARALGAVLGRPSAVPTPAFALRLTLGEFSTELLASRRLDTTRTRDLGFSFTHPELQPTLEHLCVSRSRSD